MKLKFKTRKKEELKLFEVNSKKARFALKNALILSYATSTMMFIAISAIVRVFAIDLGYGVIPLDPPLVEGDLLGYCWANLSLYSQIFSWVFATTLIQVLVAKKVNKKKLN